jgi:hypothetical protein
VSDGRVSVNDWPALLLAECFELRFRIRVACSSFLLEPPGFVCLGLGALCLLIVLSKALVVQGRCFEELLGPARYLSLGLGDALREGLGGFRYRFALVCLGSELLDDCWGGDWL